MSIRQLARHLHVHFYVARSLVESRQIPARKIGASWRITRRAADAYLETDIPPTKQTTRTDDPRRARTRLEAV
jgi:excisionase family DNA binding protein